MTVNDDPDTPAIGPDRLLLAVELIARQGPLSADELRALLGLPKTVVWRLIKKLREAGWIRLRHGGHLIELDVRLDELFATAHFADREFAVVGDIMVTLADQAQVHIDLFAPDHTGKVQLQETTRRLTAARPAHDGADEVIGLILRAASAIASDQPSGQRRARLSGVETARPVEDADPLDRNLMQDGYIWDEDKMALCVTVLGRMGTPAAIRILSKTRSARPDLQSTAFHDLRRMLRGHVTGFGRENRGP